MNRPPFYTRKKKKRANERVASFIMCSGGDAGEGRGGRTSLRRSPCLPLCYCLFHAFLWMKDFSKEFYSVPPAPALSCCLSCIMHSKKKKSSPFSPVCPSHCMPGFYSLFLYGSRRLTITAQVVSSSVLSFCMRSVWTVLIRGNELHQVLREESQILSLIHHQSSLLANFHFICVNFVHEISTLFTKYCLF